jgi:peptidoglycan/LPS O-acetylase OafA/YrhL
MVQASPAAAAGAASPHAPTPTVAESLRGHDNAFGVLRLFFALLVIVDHAHPLGGFGRDPMWGWSNGQESMGGIAVAGFFAISGYLIAKSSFDADALQFVWRRGLRIFPAYWVVLLVGAFVAGPLMWWKGHGSLAGYFVDTDKGPFTYVLRNWWLGPDATGIHDLTVATTPYGRMIKASAINGSLWTLIYEWRCYMVVLVLSVFHVFRKARPFLAVLAAGSTWSCFCKPST